MAIVVSKAFVCGQHRYFPVPKSQAWWYLGVCGMVWAACQRVQSVYTCLYLSLLVFTCLNLGGVHFLVSKSPAWWRRPCHVHRHLLTAGVMSMKFPHGTSQPTNCVSFGES